MIYMQLLMNLSPESSVKAEETVSRKYCKGPQTLTDHKRQLKLAAYTRNVKYVRTCWSNRYTTVSESAISRFLSVTIFRSACKSQHKLGVDRPFSTSILPSSITFHCLVLEAIIALFTILYMHVHAYAYLYCIATLYDGFGVMQ